MFFFIVDGEFHCIGSTILNEYKTHIEKDPVFEKCFQQLFVKEISIDDCISIIYRVKNRYEAYFGGKIYLF